MDLEKSVAFSQRARREALRRTIGQHGPVSIAAELGATPIVAEANQGGEMLRTVFYSVGYSLPVQLLHVKLSKHGRASPVAALY